MKLSRSELILGQYTTSLARLIQLWIPAWLEWSFCMIDSLFLWNNDCALKINPLYTLHRQFITERKVVVCFLSKFSSPRASHQVSFSSVDSCLHLLLLLSEGLRESVHRLLVPEWHHFPHLLKLSAQDQFSVSHLILWLSTDSSAECVCQVHLWSMLVDHSVLIFLRSQKHSLITFWCWQETLFVDHFKWLVICLYFDVMAVNVSLKSFQTKHWLAFLFLFEQNNRSHTDDSPVTKLIGFKFWLHSQDTNLSLILMI